MTRFSAVAAAFVVVLAASRHASAQDWHGQGRVEGSVTDTDGKPIEGATVSMRWTDGHGPDIKTNKKGSFAFLGLNGGAWNVDISAPGYQTLKVAYNVSQLSRNEPIKVQLAKAAPQVAPHQEITVEGKKISKETADAIEQANKAWEAKNWAEASANYDKALVELPDNVSLLEHAEIAAYNQKKFDAAAGYAKKIVAADPGNTNALLIIAETELQAGHLAVGRAALEKVPDEKITDPGPYLNLGINYYNKNDAAEAEKWFTKAIEKDASSADAYYYRGLARYNLKRNADAKADLEKSVELAPDGPNADTAKEIIKAMVPAKPRHGHG